MKFSMPEKQIVDALQLLQDQIHGTATRKGWWKDYDALSALLARQGDAYGLEPELADTLYRTARSMLAVTEIAEGVEAMRMGDPPDDKCPEFSGQTVEIADDIIRQLDLAAQFDLPVIEAIIAKVRYNEGREFQHGGKKI